MRRKWMGLLTSVSVFAMILSGCGSTGEVPTTEASKVEETAKVENKDESKEENKEADQTADAVQDAVTISYACWDSNQAELIRKMADEFEAENPNIKIDIQVNGWADYWVMLEAAATGQSLPDTFWMHSNNIFYYGSNDQLLDLTDYIQKSDLVDLSNYPEGLNSIYNINGKQYAIPKDYDTIGLWYNKTLFDEAGIEYPNDSWTWDDLYDAAKKLTKPDGSQYGFCAGLHNQEGYYNFVYQNGGTIITDDKKSGYADPKTVEAIDYYFKFVRDGLSPKIFDDKGRGEAIENGLCAMGLFGSWNLSGFASNEFMTKNFDVAVLPQGKDGKRASIFNGLGNAIAANCKHPDEAWKWIEYLSSEAWQKRQAELGIAISAFNGTADAWTAAYPNFNVKAYIDMVDYAQIRPYSNQTSVWEDKSYELLLKAYNGEEDTKAACEAVNKMMDEAIAAE